MAPRRKPHLCSEALCPRHKTPRNPVGPLIVIFGTPSIELDRAPIVLFWAPFCPVEWLKETCTAAFSLHSYRMK